MSQDHPKYPRFVLPVAELLIVVAINSTLVAFLFPAVNRARDMLGTPPILPQLVPLYDGNPWPFLVFTPVVVTGSIAALIGVLRFVLPTTIRKHFPFKPYPKPPEPPAEPILDSRPAIGAAISAIVAMGILLIAAAHVRADRTNRRPIVTWEGPLAEYVTWISTIGWLVSAIAMAIGIYSLLRCRTKLNYLAIVGIGFGFFNYFGSLVFLGLVYED